MCIRDRHSDGILKLVAAAELLRVQFPALIADLIYPVSYTHLDVYKRQAAQLRQCR